MGNSVTKLLITDSSGCDHGCFCSGSQRRNVEAKQVMFSDGIRPGGDLTELDGSSRALAPARSRRMRRVERSG